MWTTMRDKDIYLKRNKSLNSRFQVYKVKGCMTYLTRWTKSYGKNQCWTVLSTPYTIEANSS